VNERATVRETRMPAAASPDSSETTLAREVIAAWRRRDLDWLLEHSAPDVELRPLMWTGDAFRGREGLTVFVQEFLPNYEGLRIDVERVRRAADPVALDVRLRAHLRESDADLDDHATFVFELRDSRLVRFAGHVDEADIAAALSGPPPATD
jgi:ketosteroid isomerase-like protein